MATNTARRKSSLSRIRRLSGSLGGKGLIDPTTLECTAARRQSELTVEDEAELAELEQELELLEQQLIKLINRAPAKSTNLWNTS